MRYHVECTQKSKQPPEFRRLFACNGFWGLGHVEVASALLGAVVELDQLALEGLHRHVGVDDEVLTAAILVHEPDDLGSKLASAEVLSHITRLANRQAGERNLEGVLLVVRVLERVEELLAARSGLDGDVLLGGGHTDHSFLRDVSLKLATRALLEKPSHLAIPTRKRNYNFIIANYIHFVKLGLIMKMSRTCKTLAFISSTGSSWPDTVSACRYRT